LVNFISNYLLPPEEPALRSSSGRWPTWRTILFFFI